MTYGLPQIAAMRLLNQPLLLSATALGMVRDMVRHQVSFDPQAIATIQEHQARSRNHKAQSTATAYLQKIGLLSQHRSLMLVHISGPMMHNPDAIARFYLGASDYVEIADAVRAASEAVLAEQADGVVLRLDTPGGTASGIGEVLESIDTARSQGVRVIALANEQACSCGHWIASRCEAVLATPSAFLGSIGVLQAVLDSSARYEREGLRMVVVRTGELKAAGGFDGDPFTEEQEADFAQSVQDLLEPFVESVAQSSGLSRQEIYDLQGRALTARQAERMGLCELVKSARAGLDAIADELSQGQ